MSVAARLDQVNGQTQTGPVLDGLKRWDRTEMAKLPRGALRSGSD
jgi:hypothetical protein